MREAVHDAPDQGEPVIVAAFYHFFDFTDCLAWRAPLLDRMRQDRILGTILLAEEGINGTVSGSPDALDRLHAHLRAIPGNGAMTRKVSRHDRHPFQRAKVKLKRELISLGEPADPRRGVGHYVEPADWNALLERLDLVVIDARNAYETRFGRFPNAVDPNTAMFNELTVRSRELIAPGTAVATYCTGGIRCEKYTAWLRGQGFDEVYHLEGGILAYLEQVPPEENRFEGSCYVFDERISLDAELDARPGAVRCEHCGQARLSATATECPSCDPARQAA